MTTTLTHDIAQREQERQKLAADTADWIAKNGPPTLYPPDVSGEVAHISYGRAPGTGVKEVKPIPQKYNESRRALWRTAENVELITSEYPRGDVAALAKRLGLTRRELCRRAGILGVRRDV